MFWPRANGKGAIASLLTGLVLGALRLITELIHKQTPISFGPLRTLAEVNFLHFAIFLFVVCTLVLIVVSLATQQPAYEKVKGLTFKHAGDARAAVPGMWRKLNVVFSVLLVAALLTLWYIFF